jgi:hypothetical protein
MIYGPKEDYEEVSPHTIVANEEKLDALFGPSWKQVIFFSFPFPLYFNS